MRTETNGYSLEIWAGVECTVNRVANEYFDQIKFSGHLAEGREFCACSDATVSPTYVPDIVHACPDLLIDGEHGLWHLANAGEVSWADFARHAAEIVGLDTKGVEARPSHLMGYV